MKHKFIYTYVLCAALLVGCGDKNIDNTTDVKPSFSYEAVVEETRDMASISEEIAKVANPCQSVTKEEFYKKLNIELTDYDFMENESYSILYAESEIGIVGFNYDNDHYEFRLSDIDLKEDVSDSTTFSGMYYDWTYSEPLKGFYGNSCLMVNDQGQGVCQWIEGNYTYSIILRENATKEKLIFMFYNIGLKNSLVLEGYEGYLNDAIFWNDCSNYQNTDYDNDGKLDFIYREVLDNDNCKYTVQFGNGDILVVDSASIGSCPVFEHMTFGPDNTEFIIYTNYYPGACGVPCFNDFAIFEKKDKEYKVSKMPFSASQYDFSFDQFVNVAFYSEKENEITYLCKEWEDFKETVVTEPEVYNNTVMSYVIDEKTRETVEYEEAMIYRYEKDPENDDILICTAHVIYHCSDEMSFAIKYDGTQWNIVDVFMTQN